MIKPLEKNLAFVSSLKAEILPWQRNSNVRPYVFLPVHILYIKTYANHSYLSVFFVYILLVISALWYLWHRVSRLRYLLAPVCGSIKGDFFPCVSYGLNTFIESYPKFAASAPHSFMVLPSLTLEQLHPSSVVPNLYLFCI